jgi:hypothetical protein
MILHVKEKDAPVREISIEQAKFEFKNNIISRDALCWKIGMKEWVVLDHNTPWPCHAQRVRCL